MKCSNRSAKPITLAGLALALPLMGAEPVGRPWECHIIDTSSRGADGVKLGDINGDGLQDIATGWEEGGITRIYLNPGAEKSKSPWPAVTVGRTPSVEDAVFSDMDGDGMLDVVSCCEGKEKTIFVHWAPNDATDLLEADQWQQGVLGGAKPSMWMYAWPMQVDGANGVDLIAGAKGKSAEIGWFEVPADGRDLEAYIWHPISPAGWIMSMWKRDMDGDGDLDIVVSDRRGDIAGCRWLENPGIGPAQKERWTNHMMGTDPEEIMSMTLADIDGDGLEDAVAALDDNRILFMKRLDRNGLEWRSHTVPADYNAGNTRAVALADINGDQQLDLAFTTWNAKGKHGVLWLESTTNTFEHGCTAHSISGKEKGIKYDRIEMIDLDADGDLDLLTCEEREGGAGLGVVWYENPTLPAGAVDLPITQQACQDLFTRKLWFVRRMGIHYAEGCTGLGVLRVADLTNNDELVESMEQRYSGYIERNEKRMFPHPEEAPHCDSLPQGAMLLQLYRLTGKEEYRTVGLEFAEKAWNEPADHGMTPMVRWWVDDMYMLTIVQVEAYRTTKDTKYLDRAAQIIDAYNHKLQREDGLYCHGDASEGYIYPWGRGNGWAAAGMAEVLSIMPEDHPRYHSMLTAYHKMMHTLLRCQGPSGLWHQIIDVPESYEESSCSAMFAFSMAMGVNHGLFESPEPYRAAALRAWNALCGKVDDTGLLADVCVGTSKKTQIGYYLKRPKRLGDLHGQAPFLWLACQVESMPPD